MTQVIAARRVFDGTRMLTDHAVEIAHGLIRALRPAAPDERLHDGILAPAFLDLQVNGGAGQMVDHATDLARLDQICTAHRHLGCAGVLPTLISDRPQVTAAVIAAGIAAARQQMPGFLGLHLEGPHLNPRRKGAHDGAMIRPMDDADLARLCNAATLLPVLMVTLAPEAATNEQIAALTRAGAIVSLGHSDCSFEVAQAAFAAGARSATHLFNAMSQIGHRQPGLAGAVLAGDAHAGLIVDGIHVHPAVIAIALKARPRGIFLVSDCMAVAGTDLSEMRLNGRRLRRWNGRLTLADGTLAGADLTMAKAVANLIRLTGIVPERALRMASAEPARLIGVDDRFGYLRPRRPAEMVLLTDDFVLRAIWSGAHWLKPIGRRVEN